MISDFLWLDCIEESTDSLRCAFSLPDPDPYSDEEMVVCGDVLYIFDSSSDSAIVKIKLFDNFKELCVGDCYQRKNFAQTIIYALNMEYGSNIQNPYIVLSDCWGTYSGDLVSIDKVIRGVD